MAGPDYVKTHYGMFLCINKEYFILGVLMIFHGRNVLSPKKSTATLSLFSINSIRKENKVIYLICFELFYHLNKKRENCCQ